MCSGATTRSFGELRQHWRSGRSSSSSTILSTCLTAWQARCDGLSMPAPRCRCWRRAESRCGSRRRWSSRSIRCRFRPTGKECRPPSSGLVQQPASFSTEPALRGAGQDLTGEAETVAEIVRRLDGLPLAIELAAARLWELRTTDALLARLEPRLPALESGWRDATARHRTMRSAISWSYDLLSPEEQALFRRLSVFAGGFTLEMADRIVRGRAAGEPYPYADGYGVEFFGAERLGGDPYVVRGGGYPRPLALALPPLEIDVEEGVAALVNRSLIRRTEGRERDARFEMLEIIREFGLEQLEASGEAAAVRHAHAAAVMAFAEASMLVLWTSLWPFWGLGRIDDELGNVRAALTWAQAQGSSGAEFVLRIAGALWPYFQFRGLLAEARAWLRGAVAYEDAPEWPRAFGLVALGMICWIGGDDEAAETYLLEATELNRQIGHDVGVARALFFRALVAWRREQYATMAALLNEALPLFREWEDSVGGAVCLLAHGVLARLHQEPVRARELFDGAHALAASVGYRWGMATARYYAGEVMRDQGEVVEAARLLTEALAGYWAQGDAWGSGAVMSALAVMAAGHGELVDAARLFGAADTLLTKAGAFLPPTELVAYSQIAARVRGTLGDAEYDLAFAAGRDWPVEEAVAAALALGRRLAGERTSPAAPSLSVGPGTDTPLPRLSPRKLEIVRRLANGQSIKEIAADLRLNPDTVYQYLAEIRRESGAGSNAEIVARAIRGGLI